MKNCQTWCGMHYDSNTETGKEEDDPWSLWPVSVAELMSYELIRDGVSKERDAVPENDTWGCPLASTHILKLYSQVHLSTSTQTYRHTETYVCIHTHIHRDTRTRSHSKKEKERHKIQELGMMIHTCNPRTWKAEIERSWVHSHPQLHRKFGVGGQLAHTV